MSLFAQLTIFIACLGLLGLAAFSAERRRKEMSIRKVLGASAGSIMFIISRYFLKPVLLANLFAWPVVWYASRRWLEGFAYKTQLSWWFFVMAGGSAVLIALLTVSYQSLRTAQVNPSKLMQDE